MSNKLFFIGSLPYLQWKNVFEYCLNLCDRFIIHSPEEPEGYEKEFLSRLQEIQVLKVKPWKGCKCYNEISGTLNNSVRILFRKYIDGSLFDKEFELWDYQLLLGDREVLYVGDCIDKLVCFNKEELGVIEKLDIKFSDWDECNIPVSNNSNSVSDIKFPSIDESEEIMQSFVNIFDDFNKD